MSDKTREEFEQWFMSLHGSDIGDLATWGKETPFYREEDYKFASTRAQYQAWQAAKERYEPKWIDFKANPPAYGTPVILKINGTVQHVTYIRDGESNCDDWFEPYHYDDKEHGVFVGSVNSLEWMPLPEADL